MPRLLTCSISGPQPMRKFLRIHEPVAQPRVIVVALAEPAVVHHEQLDAELRGLLRQRLLARLVDVEVGRFPGVVEHRPQARLRPARQDLFALEVVQQPRRLAETRRP